MLIGLSVSCCVSDIARGKVELGDVAYIIGAVDPGQNGENVEGIIAQYNRTYWRFCDKGEGERVFRQLWGNGMILCPRANGGPVLNIADGHWLNSLQIYSPEPTKEQPSWHLAPGE